MVLWRNNLVLFGGFYEAFRESQWFNDLYLFSIQTETWRKINFSPTAAVPGVRSGFQMVVYNDTLLVNGGYTKLRSATKKDEVKVHRGETTAETSSTRKSRAARLSPLPNRRHVGVRLGFAAIGRRIEGELGAHPAKGNELTGRSGLCAKVLARACVLWASIFAYRHELRRFTSTFNSP